MSDRRRKARRRNGKKEGNQNTDASKRVNSNFDLAAFPILRLHVALFPSASNGLIFITSTFLSTAFHIKQPDGPSPRPSSVVKDRAPRVSALAQLEHVDPGRGGGEEEGEDNGWKWKTGQRKWDYASRRCNEGEWREAVGSRRKGKGEGGSSGWGER
jgi:hypothetical protein